MVLISSHNHCCLLFLLFFLLHPPKDNFGYDLQAVEAATKKHEAIETDIAAYEERVQVWFWDIYFFKVLFDKTSNHLLKFLSTSFFYFFFLLFYFFNPAFFHPLWFAAAGSGFSGKGAGGRTVPWHQTHHCQEGKCSSSVGLSTGAPESQTSAAGTEPGSSESLPGDAVRHGLDGRDEGTEESAGRTLVKSELWSYSASICRCCCSLRTMGNICWVSRTCCRNTLWLKPILGYGPIESRASTVMPRSLQTLERVRLMLSAKIDEHITERHFEKVNFWTHSKKQSPEYSVKTRPKPDTESSDARVPAVPITTPQYWHHIHWCCLTHTNLSDAVDFTETTNSSTGNMYQCCLYG